MIVTIDGPAGSGKSTAARALARRLGFEFLDTGAMFRAVALAAQKQGIDLTDHQGLQRVMEAMHLEMSSGRILLNGEDVSEQIRTPEISAGSSVVAASPVVRPRLAELQRRLAEGRSIVCEGRDQGTAVFPQAECKFFLFADPEERLRRRARELQAKGRAVDLDALRQEMTARDQRDAERELAPMKPADDAILLDSTGLTLDQVVDRMEQEVRQRRTNAPR